MKTIKIFAVLAIALAATAARAVDSYLYWMVQDARTADNTAINFAYATVSVDGGANYLSLYGSTATADPSPYLVSDGNNSSYGAPAGVYAGFNSTDDVTSFLVELWNSTDTRVGYQNYAYAELKDWIFNTSTGGSATTPYAVSQVVPEPTSGLLMLFGLAGLALRRKRRA